MSLLLQAAGGGLASSASHENKDPTTGDNIMVAGLSLQVITLLIFMGLCVDFAHRTYTRHKSLGSSTAFDQNPLFISLRNSKRFKCFLGALTLATLLIFWRSTYRVVELGEGWTGNLIRRQSLFVGFEGVIVGVACLVLNVWHPAFCFREGVEGLGGLGTSRRRKRENAVEEEGAVASGSGSDVDAGKVEHSNLA